MTLIYLKIKNKTSTVSTYYNIKALKANIKTQNKTQKHSLYLEFNLFILYCNDRSYLRIQLFLWPADRTIHLCCLLPWDRHRPKIFL